MEEMRDNENMEQDAVIPEEEGYVPRPAYQVWAARVALVLVILFVIYQLLQIAGHGR